RQLSQIQNLSVTKRNRLVPSPNNRIPGGRSPRDGEGDQMHRFCKYVLLASAASILAPISAARAADDQNTIGEVIVTARRVQERLQDVPISITVYNQDQLDKRNIFSAADLGTYTPSLSTNQRYGPDKATFAI